jgi:ADP-L-glycero-D-manno-heptose 6-epimerase
VVKVNFHFFDRPELAGIFNVGTGRAQTFNEMAESVINSCRRASGQPALPAADLKLQSAIEYVAFPEALRGKYQSFTQADLTALRAAGYDAPFLTVAEGVERYVSALARTEGAAERGGGS